MQPTDRLLTSFRIAIVGGLLTSVPLVGRASPPAIVNSRISIPAGEFLPQYAPGGSQKAVKMNAFSLDHTPVTDGEYAAFVQANSAWGRGKPARLFAEEQYLSHWVSDGKKGFKSPSAKRDFPVVFVSYFGAAAYCEWRKGRLPTTLEWEYAAVDDPKTQIEWFTNPRPPTQVGQGKANRYGVQDLHGQVWEWTSDYNASFATADNREDGQMDKNLFCGTGSMNARDRENYPAFMRYAMRSALRANYVTSNLGFRCAYDSN